jgi:hypothetical protein
MAWSTAEIEDMVAKRPRLAVALLQILARRSIDFTERIESLSVDNIARRLARSSGLPTVRGRAETTDRSAWRRSRTSCWRSTSAPRARL